MCLRRFLFGIYRFELLVRVWFEFIDDIEGLLVENILSLHVKIPLELWRPISRHVTVIIQSHCQ
jgi:hypothetical protein